jgi:hypothetical protein
MNRAGRASRFKLRRLAGVPLAVGAAAAIGACGGSGHATTSATIKASPASLVSQSFSASDAINSGQVALAVKLKLDGIAQLGSKPITLEVSGPFERSAGNQISTDLSARVSIAGSTANLGFDAVDKKLYVGLGGTFYQLPASTTPKSSVGASGASGVLSALGINPKTWLTDPHIVGTADVGGVTTEHLTAQVDIANVLNDLSKVVASTGSTGAGATTSNALSLVESAISSAQVDIYTGVTDHIVRKFDLAIDFTVPQIAAAAFDGLTGGSLNLDVTLTQLGQSQTITAPANPQPSSKLLNGVFALESQFGSLASLASLVSGGSSGG